MTSELSNPDGAGEESPETTPSESAWRAPLARAAATTSSAVPRDLLAFLTNPQPQSLLIKGAPGTGKSSLALALLSAYPGRGYLVANRVSLPALREHFPDLPRRLPLDHVVDATLFRQLVGASEAWREAERLFGPDTDVGRSRDLRSLLQLPPAFQELLARLPENRAGPPAVVVVDSWETLVEAFLEEGRDSGLPEISSRLVQRLFQNLTADAGAHLVLVLETDQRSALDYLADGILLTRMEVRDGRTERWLYAEKLRGVRISEPEVPFTLEEGRFRTVAPLPFLALHPRLHDSAPDPDPDEPGLWPGAAGLSDLFGRLPKGSMTLVECAPDIAYDVPRLLFDPLVRHVLQSGGRAMLTPPFTVTPSQTWESLGALLTPAEFCERVRVMGFGRRAEVDPAVQEAFLLVEPTVAGADDSASAAKALADQQEWLARPWSRGPTLAYGWLDVAAAVFGKTGGKLTPEQIPLAARQIQTTGQHVVVVLNSNDPFLPPLVGLCQTHLRIEGRRTRVLVSGMRPWTETMVLGPGDEREPYHLLRIV
jgi:KaiC/GvpD/RAD55 family RecA-like ATPase